MAAAYLFHLCQNHPFIDGNKRVGANGAITFLLMNNWEPTFDEEELVALVLSVASGGLRKPALIEILYDKNIGGYPRVFEKSAIVARQYKVQVVAFRTGGGFKK